MEGFVNPPSQENEEWHPEKGELDAQIDCTSLCQFRRNLGLVLVPKVLEAGMQEVDLNEGID